MRHSQALRAYQAFLAQPTPAATWCGGRAARTSADWRPFRGPLQPNSQAQALTILNAMFSYLVAASYLSGNPLALARGDAHRLKKSRSSKTQVERFLEADLWRHVLAYIEAMPTRKKGPSRRCRRGLANPVGLQREGPRSIAQGPPPAGVGQLPAQLWRVVLLGEDPRHKY